MIRWEGLQLEVNITESDRKHQLWFVLNPAAGGKIFRAYQRLLCSYPGSENI